MADQKHQSWLMQTFQNIFSAAFPQSDVEGVGIGMGEMGYDLTSTGGPISFDGDIGSPDLSRSDLPAREITNIDGGYDALSRRQRYASYEQLEELVPEIHSALNTYADEACSYDDENHVLKIMCSSEAVKEELKFLFFNSRTIDVDSRAWGMTRNVCKYGDGFWELVIDPKSPQFGVLKLNELDPHTMWRIQSRKGTLLEFQQTMMSPDYDIVIKDIKEKHNKDRKPYQSLYWRGRANSNKNLIRFAPAQVVHVTIGSEERGFKPYGISVLQPARRPAYNLRLMEDSMLLYRLCLDGNTRVRTTDGWKKISSIKPGDLVESYMPDGSTVSNVVVDAMNNGTKKTYRIRSRHAEIIATDNHPILAHKDGVQEYVDVKDLIVGKHQFINVVRQGGIPVSIPRFTKEVVAKLSDAQRESLKCESPGERSALRAMARWGTTEGGVSTLRKWGKHDTKDAAIKSIVEQTGLPKNRVIQFVYANGKCLPVDVARLICSEFDLDPSELILCNKGESNPERINLPNFVDEDFARLVGFLIGDGTIGKNCVSFCGKIDDPTSKHYYALLERYFGKVGIDPDKRRTLAVGHFRVASTAAANTFRALGLKVGPHLKRIPSWAFTASPEIRRALVEGLSDADGHERYTKRGTWFSTIRMCNKDLIEDVKELWSSIGLASGHIRKIDTKPREIDGRITPETISWEVTISELPLQRFENIISIDEYGDREVFDISLSDAPHNFIANGVPVHNSRGTERRVYYVDVGQMSGTKVDTYVEQFKNRTKRKRIYNDKTQQVDERFNPWPVRRTTPVPLLDGRTLTIEEIAKEYQDGKTNWVFSVLDDTTGKIVPGKIVWCGKNYHCSNMIRVWCDDGGYVDVAPEHPFVLRDGASKRADELQVGDSLMPLYKKISSKEDYKYTAGYPMVLDNADGSWYFTHRIVAEEALGDHKIDVKNNTDWTTNNYLEVHHKNFDKIDASPTNLQWIGDQDHRRLHSEILKERWNGPDADVFRAQVRSRIIAYNTSDAKRLKTIEDNKRHNKGKRLAAMYNGTELHKSHMPLRIKGLRTHWADPKQRQAHTEAMCWIIPNHVVEFAFDVIRDHPSIKREELTQVIRQNATIMNDLRVANEVNDRDVDKFHSAAIVAKMARMGVIEKHSYRLMKKYALSHQAPVNHQVTKIEHLTGESDDVYCMTVVGPNGEHDRHNFAVQESGNTVESYIFVSNSVDDDLYIPIRPNTNTRVDVLPGASNLSDIDDALYFRKKLYVALKIPPGYLEQTVEAATNRLSLTSLDMRFAKVIFRIQKAIANAFREVAIRHLTLLGVPREEFEDLEIIMTPSSEWREMAQAEVMQNRINLASSIKSMDVSLSDDWILERIFKLPDEEIDREKGRKRRQEIERAELEGTKLLISARYQAEIDRGNMVNQATIQQFAQQQAGAQGMGPDGQPLPQDQEGQQQAPIPTEDDLFAVAGEPNEEEPGVTASMTPRGGLGTSTERVPPRARITKADVEADREG